jgi:hypothetical protein
MRVYIITYASYDGYDNYLYSDSCTTPDKVTAEKLYKEWKDSAFKDANGDGEDSYEVFQEEFDFGRGKKYIVQRSVGYEEEFQAEIILSSTEI